MGNLSIPKSNWDGQLPPHIAKNEEIWWELFPRIKPILPPKIFRLFGVASESPSRETIGKVVLIADIKHNDLKLKIAPLLNDWGCFCILKEDRTGMRYDYMAGTGVPSPTPKLMFYVHWGLFSRVEGRFTFQVDQSLKLSEIERQRYDNNLLETGNEIGVPVNKGSECMVNISKFQHGSWENGLDIAFKAAIWLTSNREEALANIWKIRGL